MADTSPSTTPLNPSQQSSTPVSKPGRGGWVADLTSGFLVFLIALPLCLGISLASGFPPVAGILTAIVGGVLASFMGSAPLSIKGPAAGLIVIALGAVTELGEGDLTLGYQRALAVGVVAALIQIAFALSRVGVFAAIMPPAVVHGMLAAIGVIIITKQTPVLLGATWSGSPLQFFLDLPTIVAAANPEVALIGLVSITILVAMLFLSKIPALKKVPAPLIVLMVAIPLGFYFSFAEPHSYHILGRDHELGPKFLVSLPGSLLEAVTFPRWDAIFTVASIKYIVMYALVGSVESLLSVLAVDSMDPNKRASDLNKDLLAVGVGNLIASAIGGLPMISEIVRSKANVDAGATSAKANFFHGLFLLLFVALLPGLLQTIPLAALGAMLVFTGFRLASPREFQHAWHVGRDQILLFVTTLIVTLATDLLLGVGVGLVLKVVLDLVRGAKPREFVRSPVTWAHEGNTLRVRVKGAALWSNLLPVRAALSHLDPHIEEVVIDLSEATLIDHTFQDKIKLLSEEWPKAKLRYEGMEGMVASGHDATSSRTRVKAA